jgi:DNA helicase-2/ATP-dependent DNA helicase PcrA
MEDGLFPGMQTITAGESEMEEERRLAYVAITRAKKQLYVFHTRNRMLYGQTMYNPLSRFISEIPSALIDKQIDPWERDRMQARAGFGTQPSFGGKRPVSGFGAQSPITQKKTYYSDSAATPYTKSTYTTRTPANDITVGKPLTTVKKAATGAQFKTGDRVRHMTFGEGEIISAKSMGADVLYEIIFDKVGTKKLMATYARLTKIN